MNKGLLFIFVFWALPLLTDGQSDYIDSVIYNSVAASATEYIDSIEDYDDSELFNDENTVYTSLQTDTTFQKKYKGKEFVYTENKEDTAVLRNKNSSFPFNFTLRLPFLEGLLYVIIGIVALYVLYYVFSFFRNTNLELNKNVKTTVEPETEKPIERIEEVDFEQLINAAKANGNYNEAVRYYFLWYLKKLTLQNTIKWHKDKTNIDYKREITHPQSATDFQRLAYLFEWVWYRHSPVDDIQFSRIEQYFLTIIQSIK